MGANTVGGFVLCNCGVGERCYIINTERQLVCTGAAGARNLAGMGCETVREGGPECAVCRKEVSSVSNT